MKSKILIILSFMVLQINANAQWTKMQSTFPTGDTPYIGSKHYFLNQKIGYVIRLLPDGLGLKTRMYKSSDYGDIWNRVTTFPEGKVTDRNLGFGFKDTLTLYASNDENTYKSIDGGNTWNKILDKSARGIFVFNDTIILIHQQDSIYFSSNAGANFVFYNSDKYVAIVNLAEGNYIYLKIFDGSYGLLQRDSIIYKTTNSCKNWTKVCDLPKEVRSLPHTYFYNETYGFASGGGNSANWKKLWRTIDGGKSWQHIFSAPTSIGQRMHFITPQIGFIQFDGSIYKTNDSGFTWCNISYGSNAGLADIHFFDNDNGYFYPMFDGLNQYYVRTTNQGGPACQSTKGILEMDNQPLKAYPNPFSNSVAIELPEKAYVEVINILGQIQYSGYLDEDNNTIGTEAFSTGFYIIKARLENGTVLTVKMVKE